MAKRRTIDAAGAHVEQIDESQPQGAADHRGCAIAIGQRVEAGVRSDLKTDRPVDDHQDGASSGARGYAMQKKLVLHHGLPRRGDHGKVHRQAASHDGIDSELLSNDRLGADRLDPD
jgi:hypothetical protein